MADYETLGDIASELQKMRDAGMTYESVQFAIGKVYWLEIEDSKRREKVFNSLAGR